MNEEFMSIYHWLVTPFAVHFIPYWLWKKLKRIKIPFPETLNFITVKKRESKSECSFQIILACTKLLIFNCENLKVYIRKKQFTKLLWNELCKHIWLCSSYFECSESPIFHSFKEESTFIKLTPYLIMKNLL